MGIPARIILDEQDKTREETAAKLGFSAYAVSAKAEDDPLAKALQGMLERYAGGQAIKEKGSLN